MTPIKIQRYIILIVVIFGMEPFYAKDTTPMQRCIFAQISKASDDITLGELKALCKKKIAAQGGISTVKKESKPAVERLAFTPYKANYILPISYNDTPNSEPFDEVLTNENINNFEIIFQLSSKMRILDNVFGDNGDLYGAYTGRFWWQAYNNALSSPFREANHEPELFLDFESDIKFGEWHLTNITYGMVHQSNGRSQPLSRSWNRFYMLLKLKDKDAWVHFKPWFHIPEDKKTDINEPEGDDNPDIDRYMGYFELTAGYDFGENHLAAMIRNNLRADNKGALQLDWIFPIWDLTDVRGYVQYFNGYGESMIDYNTSTNRLSIGFIMSENDH